MRLLRVDEVADRLGLKPATIRKMIFRRELPVVRPTRRAVRVREEDVEALCRVGYKPRVVREHHAGSADANGGRS